MGQYDRVAKSLSFWSFRNQFEFQLCIFGQVTIFLSPSFFIYQVGIILMYVTYCYVTNYPKI